MFKKKKKVLGIPSLTDKVEPELPELPQFEEEGDDEETEETDDDTESQEDETVKVEDYSEEEDEIPDEIDLDDEEVEEGEIESETIKTVKPQTKQQPKASEQKKVDKEEIVEEPVKRDFYTPVSITINEQGLTQTTIISNVDLKLIAGKVYYLDEEGNEQNLSQQQPQSQLDQPQITSMKDTEKKLCLGCFKMLGLYENCNCKNQSENNPGYKAVYVRG